MSTCMSLTYTTEGLTALRDFFARKVNSMAYCAGGTWVDCGKPAVTLSGTTITFTAKADVYGKFQNGTTLTGVRLVDGSGVVVASGTTAMAVASTRTGIYLRTAVNFANASNA